MNIYTKTIIGLIIVGAIVAGYFLYVTRPVDLTNTNQSIPVTESATTSEPVAQGTAQQLVIDQSQSQASFTLQEDLNGKRTTVIGTSAAIAGAVSLKTDAPARIDIGTVTVDARTFKTDNERRNSAIVRLILNSETEGNEFVSFTATSVSQFPNEIIPGDEFPITINGNLTIKGTTKPATFTGRASYTGGVLIANVQSEIAYKDYKVSVPDLPFLANVEDTVTAKLTIVAR